MICAAKTFQCLIFRHYLATGGSGYRGEFCHGCLWFEESDQTAPTMEDQEPAYSPSPGPARAPGAEYIRLQN